MQGKLLPTTPLGIIIVFALFALAIAVVISLVIGLLGFIGLMLLVACAYMMFKGHGQVKMNSTFGVLLVLGLGLLVVSYSGLAEIYQLEFETLKMSLPSQLRL